MAGRGRTVAATGGAAPDASRRAAATAADRGTLTTDPTAPRNEVLLVGRVSGSPDERELPSGDLLVHWRVVVERAAGRRPPPGVRPATVDTVDCVAWTAPLRRTAGALLPDHVVEGRGALRRRFWRAGTGAASRYEVEATSVRRVARGSGPRS